MTKNSKWVKLIPKNTLLKLKEDSSFTFCPTEIAKKLNIPDKRVGELLKYYDIEYVRKTKNKKLTTGQWIKSCKKVHGNKYDYSKSIYVNNNTLITIICPVHGEIEVSPQRHKEGGGCRRCSSKISSPFKKSSLDSFIEESNKIHDNKYDYSLIKDFDTLHDKVKIICPEHGTFKQKMYTHKYGGGCEKCSYIERGLEGRVGVDEFIERVKKIHNNKYNYDDVFFNILDDTVKIKCPHHGVFEQKAKNHLNGGCHTCGKIYSAYSYKKDESYIEEAKKLSSGLYILKFKDFYKIGFAKNLNNRINLIKSRLKLEYSPEVLFYEKMSLFNSTLIEGKLEEKFKEYRFTYHKYFEGMTECYNTDLPIEEVKEYISKTLTAL